MEKANKINPLRGAFELLKFKADGLSYFQDTVSDALASFRLAIFFIPMHLIMVWLSTPYQIKMVGLLPFILIQTCCLIIIWPGFFLVMQFIMERMGKMDRFALTVQVINWVFFVQLVVTTPVFFAMHMNILTPDSGALMFIAMRIWMFFYQMFAFKQAMKTFWWIAAVFVIFDISFSISVFSLIDIHFFNGGVPISDEPAYEA